MPPDQPEPAPMTTTPAPPAKRPRLGPGARRGVLLMFVSTIGFSAMHAGIRHLSAELHPFEIGFFRNVFGLLVVLPFFLRHGLGTLRTGRIALHGVRAAVNVFAMLTFFYALSVTPLSQASALAFSAPIFATVLAALVLGEVVRVRRWAAIAFGFAGTLVLIRPGFAEVGLGSILVLLSSMAWAVALLTIKALSRTEPSVTIVTYMMLLMTPLSLVPALLVWQWPDGMQWLWLMAMAVLGTGGQWLMTQALKEADTAVVMPFDFFKLIWASILGYAFFAEIPDQFTWLGGAMIFASALYITLREARLRGTKPPAATAVPPGA